MRSPLSALLALVLVTAVAHAGDGHWSYDPATDVVQSVLVADGITSTLRLETRDRRPWLVWEYRGPERIAELEAINLIDAGPMPFAYDRAEIRSDDRTSRVEIPLYLEALFRLGEEGPPHREEPSFIRMHYRLEGRSEGNTWYQELGSRGAAEAIAAWKQAHVDAIRDDRYLSRSGPLVEAYTVEQLAALDGAIRVSTPPDSEDELPVETSTAMCAALAMGDLDAMLAFADLSSPGLTPAQLAHRLNCNPNRRDYAPGQHALSHMIEPVNLFLSYNAIYDMLQMFEEAGPESAAYISNLMHCRQLVMKRCGRGCYRYPEAVTLFDEIARAYEDAALEQTLRRLLRNVAARLRLFQRDHPVVFDPQACPSHLTRREAPS